MAVDEGERDDYVRRLRQEIAARRNRIGVIKGLLSFEKLEDDAQLALSPAQNNVLAQAGIVDRPELAALAAERTELNAEIDAINALITAVKALV